MGTYIFSHSGALIYTFFKAASIGSDYAVELLLKNGAKSDLADAEGKTPLHWAVQLNVESSSKPQIDNDADEVIKCKIIHFLVYIADDRFLSVNPSLCFYRFHGIKKNFLPHHSSFSPFLDEGASCLNFSNHILANLFLLKTFTRTARSSMKNHITNDMNTTRNN